MLPAAPVCTHILRITYADRASPGILRPLCRTFSSRGYFGIAKISNGADLHRTRWNVSINRCRTTSNINTDPATPAFSDSIFPDIGIEIFCVANSTRFLACAFRLTANYQSQWLVQICLPARYSVHIRQKNLQIFCLSLNFFPFHGPGSVSESAPIPERRTLGAKASVVSGGRNTAAPARPPYGATCQGCQGLGIWSGIRTKFGNREWGWGRTQSTARNPLRGFCVTQGFHQTFGNFFHQLPV